MIDVSNTMAKDQKWNGKSCSDTGMFYPADLKSVYYKYYKPSEGLVHWADWKEEEDAIAIIR